MKRKEYTPKMILADLPEPIGQDISSFLVRNPQWIPEPGQVRNTWFVLIRTWLACRSEKLPQQLPVLAVLFGWSVSISTFPPSLPNEEPGSSAH